MDKIIVKIKRITDKFSGIPLPEYATENSSGMDIRAALDEAMILGAGKIALVPTNLSVEIPPGYEIQVRPRSGLAIKEGIGVLNSPGTIDADYRGEIKIILFNFSDKNFVINNGDRIAQIVLAKVYRAGLEVSDTLQQSDRGEGGFGSTGKK